MSQLNLKSLEELIIPLEYRLTAKGDDFLLYDSGPGPQRILIFGTQMNLEMLNTSQIWLSDGTFKTAPTLFAQVYCIHGLRGGPNLLEDGLLLPNKMETTYKRMWE